VGEFAKDDQEDDEARDPGHHLVEVHDLVAEEGDEERAGGDDDDAGITWHVGVDGMDQLRAYNDVDGRPAKAGKTIEDGDYDGCVSLWSKMRIGNFHTDFDAVVAKEEPAENHLSHAKARAKCRKEAHRQDSQDVDEEDGQDRVDEA
jgi:hypothetical protein